MLNRWNVVAKPTLPVSRSPLAGWRVSLMGLIVAGGVGGVSTVAMAQGASGGEPPEAAAGQPGAGLPDVEVLKDFIHFVRIARYDVASSLGQELLSRDIAPADFVRLVEGSDELNRFEESLGRGMRVAEVEPVAAGLFKLYQTGKLAIARDPEEIARNIALLTGATRGRLLASERLQAAGEYAVPQLLTALLDRANVELRAQSQRVLVGLGPQAVGPLAAALLGSTPEAQERIADVLGAIPYRNSLPFLAEVRTSSNVPEVRGACERAMLRIDPSSLGKGTSELYLELANRYYKQIADVTSFPSEEFQLLWDFKPQIGLFMTAIRTPVYHEAMAMRLAERTLKLEETNGDALSLWLAANLRRELQTPEGYDNPAYGKDRRDAMYFAVAAGSKASQSVLARALADRDTQLARRAIAAVEQTAGATSLVATELPTQPLLDALGYPNRRVRYEAALAIGRSQPSASFDRADRVVPTLAGAIREATAKYVAIVASDPEKYNAVRGMLEKDGFTVLPRGKDVNELNGPIAEVPAVDLIVAVDPNAEQFPAIVADVVGSSKLAATPVLGLTESTILPELRARYETSVSVSVRPLALNDSEIIAAVNQLIDSASGGPITSQEASMYTGRALAVLRDLAVQNNQVLNVADAGTSLVRSLTETQGGTKQQIAEVLSRIDQKQTQVALMEAALAATGSERLDLLTKVTDSAKRFGNRLEPRHVTRVLELAESSNAAEATAGAALAGALDLTNDGLIPMILGETQQAAR